MKSITLTKGKLALVDDEDFEHINQFSWYYSNGYAYRPLPRKTRKKPSISMHRLIMDDPAGKEVDHINGNRLDNRRSNLRICTKAENRRNLGLRSTNSTGFKGVCFRKDIKKYQAQITVNSKSVYLGYYPTAQQAAHAYNDAAVKYYGEFARLNEI